MNTNTESQPSRVQDHAWLLKLIASSAAAGLGVALLAALTGCVGYVDGGYYGGPVVAAAERGPVWGTQFHPEKSGSVGLGILTNFVAAVDASIGATP